MAHLTPDHIIALLFKGQGMEPSQAQLEHLKSCAASLELLRTGLAAALETRLRDGKPD